MQTATSRSAMRTRCFSCRARPFSLAPDGWSQCDWCGAQWRGQGYGEADILAEELEEALGPGRVCEQSVAGHDWRLNGHALRIAASRFGLWFVPDKTSPRLGPANDSTVGVLEPLRQTRPVTVGLVTLARRDDATLDTFLQEFAPYFASCVAVIDGPDRPCDISDGLAKIWRLLDSDFAAQRNAGQRASTCDWTFHLDLDERVTPEFCENLPFLAARAATAGLAAIAFPRRNFVDGRLSDLFPDVQYRLVPADARFRGNVHERPDACADWTRTSVWLGGAIDHDLSRDRVMERSRLYDAMGQRPAQRTDDTDLLTAYRD